MKNCLHAKKCAADKSQRDSFDFACRLNWGAALFSIGWTAVNRVYVYLALLVAMTFAVYLIAGMSNFKLLVPALEPIFFWATILVGMCLRAFIVFLAIRANSIAINNYSRPAKTHEEFQSAIVREQWKQKIFFWVALFYYIISRCVFAWTSAFWSGVDGWNTEVAFILDALTFFVLLAFAFNMKIRRKKASFEACSRCSEVEEKKYTTRNEIQRLEKHLQEGLLTPFVKALVLILTVMLLSIFVFATTAFTVNNEFNLTRQRIWNNSNLLSEVNSASMRNEIILSDLDSESKFERINASAEIGFDLTYWQNQSLQLNAWWIQFDRELVNTEARIVFLSFHGRVVGAYVEVRSGASFDVVSLAEAQYMYGVVTFESHLRETRPGSIWLFLRWQE